MAGNHRPDFIAKAFAYAHEADANAILRYSDYGLENPAKRRKLLTVIKSLKEQGVPVMANGTQTQLSSDERHRGVAVGKEDVRSDVQNPRFAGSTSRYTYVG